MPYIRKLDPGASPLDFFGSELRRLREAAGLSQDKLGSMIYCTGSLVGQVETATKCPTREFTERADAALGANGALLRLLKLVLRSELPKWFQPYAELEAQATHIYSFQPQLVDGLLQTEDYARAVLGVDYEGAELDSQVAARMERQRILKRENPPLVWVVMSEAVLHEPMGGPEAMRAQLAHLLSFRNSKWVHVQVLPTGIGAHPGMMGAFYVLHFTDQPTITYVPGYGSGRMKADPADAKARSCGYALLQAAALSVEASAEPIARVMEERYGEHPQPD